MHAPMDIDTRLQDMKDPSYELFIIFISILSVVNLIISWIPGLDIDAVHVLTVINLFLTIIFLADFLFRFFTADSKTRYFFQDWGWADLLASIPALRLLRIFRIFKAFRLLYKFGTRNIYIRLMERRAESVLFIVIFCVLLVIESGAFLVVLAERSAPHANILTASDAIWWVYVTITTVGYGDYYPVTNAGRAIGIIVMTMGVGLFGTLAGYIANKLLAPTSVGGSRGDVTQDPKSSDMEAIRAFLREQNRQNAELAARLERIETQLGRREKK
jgi:voltage-gated potassium channel